MGKLRGKSIFLILIGSIVLADQVSKLLIKSHLPLYGKFHILPGFFKLHHIHNSGAVWGLFSSGTGSLIPKLITAASLIAMVIILYYFLKVEPACRPELVAMSFIIGGALGNNVDRIIQGFVVDFLEFNIGRYHWPIFNVADSFVTIGVFLLIFSLWRGKCLSMK